MTTLYPIGTQLITRRLSQAALYVEIFGKKLKALTEREPNNFRIYERAYCKRGITIEYWLADAWRVTVTEENQKWLSPVPMVGDKVQYHKCAHGSLYVSNIESIDDDVLYLKADPSTDAEVYEEDSSIYQVYAILKRTYPNGQRAPLIEWDEVILPEWAVA